jgi:pyruvate formate lyase activating enzyme
MKNIGSVFEIRRFCIHDGPGIRSTVFFHGCPLNCTWCHNPESKTINHGNIKHFSHEVSVDDVIHEVMRDAPFYDQSSGGITCSGGEPLAQPEFLESLLQTAKENGLHTVVDTCGYASLEDFKRIEKLTDLFLYDIKLIDPTLHLLHTGVSNELILENFRNLAETGKSIWVRIPLIPGITDTIGNFKAIADFLKPYETLRKINLLPYNKLFEDKFERFHLPDGKMGLEPQSEIDLNQKAEWFIQNGFDVKIGG